MKAIRIKKTESSPVGLKSDLRIDLFQEYFVAVTLKNVDIGPASDETPQTSDLVAIKIDKKVLLEGR